MQLLPKGIVNKIKNRVAYNAYASLMKPAFTLSVAKALGSVLKTQKGKKELTTAFADPALFCLSESLADCGFVIKDPKHSFFGGADHPLYPANPPSSVSNVDFDAILGPSHLDLLHFANSIDQALRLIKRENFITCLNQHKLFVLAALVCLIPDDTSIVEVGSYQCGTTIFMAQLCKILRKKVHIYACDTFEGMPTASSQDRKDPIYYDEGMFTDNEIKKVQQRINDQRVQDTITLVKGNVRDTLPSLGLENVSLVFLDTDQYGGTKAGLDFVSSLSNSPHIVVDDTSLSSVRLAIEEFLDKRDGYRWENVCMNFDYLAPL